MWLIVSELGLLVFLFTYVNALVFNVHFYFWVYFFYACIIASMAKALSLCLEFPRTIITIFYTVFLSWHLFSKMRITTDLQDYSCFLFSPDISCKSRTSTSAKLREEGIIVLWNSKSRADKLNIENGQDYYLFVKITCWGDEANIISSKNMVLWELLDIQHSNRKITYFGSVFDLLNSIQNMFPVKTFFIHLASCYENLNITFYFIQNPSCLISHWLSIL